MPRDGSNIYHRPVGTDGVPNYPIESTKYNAYVADVEQDLNLPRPIVAGGTGASNATDALFNLKAETATQIVTNWDSQIWVPGSFYAAASATGAAPVPGHAFAGQCYIGEPLANPPTNQNIILEARDLDSPVQPGPISARQMKAGVWSPWSTTSTAGDQARFRQSIYAAPFDAMAYSGMQINGSMDVSQEMGTAATATHNAYILDGYMFAKATTGIVAASQQLTGSVFPGFTNYLLMAVTTAGPATPASADLVGIQSRIEGWRVARLAWGTASAQPITIGFWTQHNRTGVYSVGVRNAAGDRCYITTYTQNGSDVSEYKTVTIPGDVTGVWLTNNSIGINVFFAMVAGSTRLTAPNVWGSGAFWAATGQVNAGQAVTDRFRITGLVVLPGIEAPSAARSPLIMRPYDQELVTCQRYYTKSYNYATAPGTASTGAGAVSGIAYNTTNIYGINAVFKTRMRAVPTIALYSFLGTQGVVTVGGTNSDTVAASVGGTLSENSFNTVSSSGLTAGTGYYCNYVADARL